MTQLLIWEKYAKMSPAITEYNLAYGYFIQDLIQKHIFG